MPVFCLKYYLKLDLYLDLCYTINSGIYNLNVRYKMSLQVWCPFTDGTLKQQGLNRAVISSSGTVSLTNVGKLGKCVTFTSTSGGLTIPASTMTSFTTECSVAFWLKINAWGSSYDTYFQAGTGSTPWNNYIFGFLRNNTNSTICFTIGDTSTASNANYLTSSLSTGVWYHIALVYQTGSCQIYLNGQLDHQYTTTIVPKFSGITKITVGRCNNDSSYQTQCSINDLRIYNHALTQEEIQKLSQGLIVHYPLNRQGWGQENILLNTGFQSRYTQSTGWDTTKNGTQLANNWNGYNSGVSNQATVYHAHLKEFNGEWVYEYIRTANESWLGISQSGLQSKITAGKTYTFSWEEYHVDGTNRVGTGLYYFKTGATSANFHLGIQEASDITRVVGKWQKYTYTFVAPSDADWSKSMSWYIYGHYNGNGTFYMRHPKLEEGSIATPWCPNTSDALATAMDLNSTTEYDCSGYCNNGTRTGTFTWTSDTPKYLVSTSAQGSSGAKIIGPGMPTEARSAAIWVKCAKTVDSVFFADKNSTLECGLLNSLIYANTTNSAGFTTTHWKDNQWNHVVVVNDNGTRRVYVNGEPETASGANNYYMHTTDAVYLWTRSDNNSYPFNGQMSDFRIYATALSASDVKSLYQNCATIGPDGTIYGQIRS